VQIVPIIHGLKLIGISTWQRVIAAEKTTAENISPEIKKYCHTDIFRWSCSSKADIRYRLKDFITFTCLLENHGMKYGTKVEDLVATDSDGYKI